jgi:hypothetical protein
MTNKVRLWYPELEDFAHELLGLPDNFDGEVTEVLEEHFDCDFDTFTKIIEAVIQYTPTHISPLTKRLHRGFIKDGHFILKYEVKEQHHER